MCPPLPSWTLMSALSSFSCILTFFLFANPPCLYPHHLSILPTPLPLSVLWWGAGWPWIPLLLWGNNRPFLLLCTPLSPTWGPQSTGKKSARGTRTASRVCGREGEWERGVTTNKISKLYVKVSNQETFPACLTSVFGVFDIPLSFFITPCLSCFVQVSHFP